MSDYSEKLKHPNWQRKRLEILNRDGFKCRACGDTEETLHVHHLFYVKGRDPWDYPNASLVTLCHVCHDVEHEDIKDAKDCLVTSLRNRGAMYMDFYSFAVALDMSGSNDVQMNKDEWSHLAWFIARAMEHRNAGGSLEALYQKFLALCEQED